MLTHHPAAVPVPPGSRRRRLALVAAAVVLTVGGITLGPAGAVGHARNAVMDAIELLMAPWPGTVHRAPVEFGANVLLFVPVGVLATVVLRRWSRVLPLVLGVAASVLVELAQTVLPGRVPDLVDVAANGTGTAVGVAVSSIALAATRRARRGRLPALVALPLVLVGLAACSSGAPPQTTALAAAPTAPAAFVPQVPAPGGGGLSAADGLVADGVQLSPFSAVPALTRLDPALRTALQRAAQDAASDGVDLVVTTGWRSAAYQQSLFDAAVQRYGSPEAARQWVLRPEESAHVTGDAVDVGPVDAMDWLSRHGSDHGLCRTYANEMWHFQLAVEPGGVCPAPAADPTSR